MVKIAAVISVYHPTGLVAMKETGGYVAHPPRRSAGGAPMNKLATRRDSLQICKGMEHILSHLTLAARILFALSSFQVVVLLFTVRSRQLLRQEHRPPPLQQATDRVQLS
jgi:hypothetical protein